MKLGLDDRLANLEFLATSMSDSDTEWWPFTFLRPAQHERLSSRRCVLISMLHSVPLAVLVLIGGLLAGDEVRSIHLLAFPLCVCVAYFVLFRSTFAYFWNRRAARLRPLYERRAKWRGEAGGPSAGSD